MHKTSRMVLEAIDTAENGLLNEKVNSDLELKVLFALKEARIQIIHLEDIIKAQEDDWK